MDSSEPSLIERQDDEVQALQAIYGEDVSVGRENVSFDKGLSDLSRQNICLVVFRIDLEHIVSHTKCAISNAPGILDEGVCGCLWHLCGLTLLVWWQEGHLASKEYCPDNSFQSFMCVSMSMSLSKVNLDSAFS